MTRCHTRGNIPRPPHISGNNRPSMGNNFIYYLRSSIFFLFFLSIFPQQPVSCRRIRKMLATCWNSTIQPIPNSSFKYSHSFGLRGHCHMKAPCYFRIKPLTGHSKTCANSTSRVLFLFTTSARVLWSTLHYRRLSLRSNILCCHRLPWATCYHWVFFSTSMFIPYI